MNILQQWLINSFSITQNHLNEMNDFILHNSWSKYSRYTTMIQFWEYFKSCYLPIILFETMYNIDELYKSLEHKDTYITICSDYDLKTNNCIYEKYSLNKLYKDNNNIENDINIAINDMFEFSNIWINAFAAKEEIIPLMNKTIWSKIENDYNWFIIKNEPLWINEKLLFLTISKS